MERSTRAPDKDLVVLAVDHGTSSVKASLVTVHGQILGTASAKTPIRFLSGGGAEQNPNDWWNALVRASSTI